MTAGAKRVYHFITTHCMVSRRGHSRYIYQTKEVCTYIPTERSCCEWSVDSYIGTLYTQPSFGQSKMNLNGSVQVTLM